MAGPPPFASPPSHSPSEVKFLGTTCYASMAAQSCQDTGRVDDLWSLAFALMELCAGLLPWDSLYGPAVTAEERQAAKLRVLEEKKRLIAAATNGDPGRVAALRPAVGYLARLPKQLVELVREIAPLKYSSCPDYTRLRALLLEASRARGARTAHLAGELRAAVHTAAKRGHAAAAEASQSKRARNAEAEPQLEAEAAAAAATEAPASASYSPLAASPVAAGSPPSGRGAHRGAEGAAAVEGSPAGAAAAQAPPRRSLAAACADRPAAAASGGDATGVPASASCSPLAASPVTAGSSPGASEARGGCPAARGGAAPGAAGAAAEGHFAGAAAVDAHRLAAAGGGAAGLAEFRRDAADAFRQPADEAAAGCGTASPAEAAGPLAGPRPAARELLAARGRLAAAPGAALGAPAASRAPCSARGPPAGAPPEAAGGPEVASWVGVAPELRALVVFEAALLLTCRGRPELVRRLLSPARMAAFLANLLTTGAAGSVALACVWMARELLDADPEPYRLLLERHGVAQAVRRLASAEARGGRDAAAADEALVATAAKHCTFVEHACGMALSVDKFASLRLSGSLTDSRVRRVRDRIKRGGGVLISAGDCSVPPWKQLPRTTPPMGAFGVSCSCYLPPPPLHSAVLARLKGASQHERPRVEVYALPLVWSPVYPGCAEVYKGRPPPTCAFVLCLACWAAAAYRLALDPSGGDPVAAGACLTADALFSPHPAKLRRYLLHALWPLEAGYVRGFLTSTALLVQGFALENQEGTAAFALQLAGFHVVASAVLLGLGASACQLSLESALAGLAMVIHSRNPQVHTDGLEKSLRVPFVIEPRWHTWLIEALLLLTAGSFPRALAAHAVGLAVGGLYVLREPDPGPWQQAWQAVRQRSFGCGALVHLGMLLFALLAAPFTADGEGLGGTPPLLHQAVAGQVPPEVLLTCKIMLAFAWPLALSPLRLWVRFYAVGCALVAMSGMNSPAWRGGNPHLGLLLLLYLVCGFWRLYGLPDCESDKDRAA
ncbi:unnamed protein product [Prorocentrum cordatum]|uniref:Protein kinase domain-containing protein n=1 Tax=Prorocentrum cordatum TaxID=2364126 RepID=A0ABN9Y746_9DINO|nr:unnamed protein product [Polarella glacialis]